MLLQDKKVAIIGGGPGGLMLARLLQQKEVDVKVYERDTDRDVRQQGATLDLHADTGLKAIVDAGLMEAFKKHYRPGADKMKVLNSNLDVLLNDHPEKPEEDFGNEHFRPEIDRGPLRDLLIASLEEGNVVWNARFKAMTPSGSGWQLQFENGTTAYADIVIASDGANSRVRKYITGIVPVYSGVTAIEINVYHAEKNLPALWNIADGGKLFALEKGKTILFSPKADGTLTFLVGWNTPEEWVARSGVDFTDKTSVADWFRLEFADWAPDWESIFNAEAVSMIPRPMYHFPTDQQWQALPNLTMIGDAAHRMPPYAGEGANQALADALELAEALCSDEFRTAEQAIAAYELEMRSRTAAITEITLQMTAALHQPDNLDFLLGFFGEVVEAGRQGRAD